jgi:hypothetical protein
MGRKLVVVRQLFFFHPVPKRCQPLKGWQRFFIW